MTSDADRIIDLYQCHAHNWDKERGRDLAEKTWLDKFPALLVPDEPLVLDVGCGSGEPIGNYLNREWL
jgi:hypothetical protein